MTALDRRGSAFLSWHTRREVSAPSRRQTTKGRKNRSGDDLQRMKSVKKHIFVYCTQVRIRRRRRSSSLQRPACSCEQTTSQEHKPLSSMFGWRRRTLARASKTIPHHDGRKAIRETFTTDLDAEVDVSRHEEEEGQRADEDRRQQHHRRPRHEEVCRETEWL
jgi:hypothetical protein